MVPVFQLPGYGSVESLDDRHIAGWNRIASDPGTRLQLSLPELTPEILAEDRGRRSLDWRAAVRKGSAERQELVVVNIKGDVCAAVSLAYYSCDSDDEFGVSVEVAVEASARGGGLGTSLMRELRRWLDAEVPGAHVFADVCTSNARSERMLRSAGWRKVTVTECNVWDRGRHQCAGEANRYCGHSSHCRIVNDAPTSGLGDS